MTLTDSFYKKDAEAIIAAFLCNDLKTVKRIHMRHADETHRMMVMLPAIELASTLTESNPIFSLAVFGYLQENEPMMPVVEAKPVKPVRQAPVLRSVPLGAKA